MRPCPLLVVVLALLGACEVDEVSPELGAACGSTLDCTFLCLPDGDDFPGGFCSKTCARDDECPAAARCVDKEGGVCLFECRDDRDCDFLQIGTGPDWRCAEVDAMEEGTRFVCLGET